MHTEMSSYSKYDSRKMWKKNEDKLTIVKYC